ncbi:MAG: ABC transporter substrate-binding protein [Candidatus Thorarchaeota archaeon]
MKKEFLILAVLTMAGLLTVNPNTHHSSAQTTATYSLWYAAPKHIETFLKTQITAFQLTNQDIKITATAISNEDFREDYFDAFTKGTQPDLVLAPTTWIPSLVATDRLKTTDLGSGVFRDEAIRLVSYWDSEGKVQTYGYPLYLDTTVMVYNQQIFDDYGVDMATQSRWSWSEFEYAVRKATNQTNPAASTFGTILEGMMSFEAYFYGNGSRLFKDYKVDANHIVGDSSQALGTFNYIDRLLRTYEVMPAWEDHGTLASVLDLMGTQERAATVFLPISKIYPLLNESSVGQAGDLRILETPEKGGALHGQALLLHSDLTEEAESDLSRFCDFLVSEEIQEKIASEIYLAPVLKEGYSASSPIFSTIKNAIDRAYQKPISLHMLTIEDAFQDQAYQLLEEEKTTEQAQTAISIIFRQRLPDVAPHNGLPTELGEEEGSEGVTVAIWTFFVGMIILALAAMRRKRKLR